ncbi:MAG: glycosyltransferase family 4 protein [Candidatus Hydrogenedentota bacterium]
MRILIATSDYPPALGGMAEYSAAWAAELDRAGCDVDVLARDHSAPSAGRKARVDAMRCSWNPGPLRDPWNALACLKRAEKNSRPDIVMAHTWIGWGPALAWLKGRTGIPYVLSAHGAEILGPRSSAYYAGLMTQSFRGADAVFAVSSFTKNHVAALGLSKERIDVIGNGVDVSRFSPGPGSDGLRKKFGLEGKRVLLTVGGLVERKGHDTVIDALSRLRDSYPDLMYLIAGGWAMNSSREGYLKEIVARRGLQERVVFTGFVADEELPEIYRLADIFVMTGREIAEKGWVEGFGISYLEAAAAGLPVVASDTGGVSEAVCGSNAIMVPSDDAVATAAALSKLLDDSALRSTMSLASRAWAGECTWTKRVSAGRAVMERIIAG